MKMFWGQAMVIARRDFMSIVGTPTFLMFLLAPILMLTISGIGGVGAASMATSSEDNARIVVIAQAGDVARIEAADKELRLLFTGRSAPPTVTVMAPGADLEAQAKAILADDKFQTSAVMRGNMLNPTISFTEQGERTSRYLAEVAEVSARSAAAGVTSLERLSKPRIIPIKTVVANVNTRQAVGVSAVFVIFLLTLLLAGQTVGMLAEEKSNKVIEILAAAVRLEAVFFGKLIGMFGVAMVFIGFWGTIVTAGLLFVPTGNALAAFQPAVGLPLFLALGGIYFTMAFMLLGGVFLGVGAQASTMREIQMMSLPITIFQLAMFGLSSAAAGTPGSKIATFAEIFPFSSPFAMAARAATDASIWPHVAALAWQGLWVAITITIAAKLFRAGVLKAGGGFWAAFGFRRTRSVL